VAAWVVLLFIGWDALGGMLRWILAGAGLAALAYLPMAIGLGYGVHRCLVRILGEGELAMALWLVFQALVGCICVANLAQVLFGLWVLTPVLIGYTCLDELEAMGPWTWRILAVVYLVLVAGVMLNQIGPSPWEGHAYSFGGQEIVGTRRWATGGFRRVAGTQRSSIGAAALILVLAILLRGRLARAGQRAALLASAGIGILFTTTKGVLLSWLLVVLATILAPLTGPVAAQGLVLLCLAGSVLLPVAGVALLPFLPVNNPIVWLLLFSTDDRIRNIWPRALHLVHAHGHWALGRGLGGMGTAQMYFEPQSWNPGDNVALFLWGNFGLVGVALYCWLCFRLVERMGRPEPGAAWVAPALLFFTSYGVTNNNIESTAMGLLLGMLMAKASGRRP
jgi:hypothetical protein